MQQGARKNLFTGKTYNSLDNISQFFAERGMSYPNQQQRPAASGAGAASAPHPQQAPPGVRPTGSAPHARPLTPPTGAPPAYRPTTPTPAPPGRSGYAGSAGQTTNSQASRFNTPLPPKAATGSYPQSKVPPPPKVGSRQGTVVEHPKYGTGTVVRREGEGPDAKLTVLFPGYGLKKLVERYAGLKKT